MKITSTLEGPSLPMSPSIPHFFLKVKQSVKHGYDYFIPRAIPTQVCSWGIFDKGCQRHKKSEKWKENKNKRLSVLNCSIIIGGNLTQYQTSLVGTWDSTWTFFPAYYSTHVFHMCSIQTSSHSIFAWWIICRNIVHVRFIY